MTENTENIYCQHDFSKRVTCWEIGVSQAFYAHQCVHCQAWERDETGWVIGRPKLTMHVVRSYDIPADTQALRDFHETGKES